jgi:hypothetical protein
MVAFVSLERLTKKISFGSEVVSPRIGTRIAFAVCPGSKVSVPATPLKSTPEAALSDAVAYPTVTVLPLTAESVTVNEAHWPNGGETGGVQGPTPTSPSFTATASEIDSVGSGSSSVIVPSPCPSATFAPTAPERFTKKVSSASSSRSPCTGTLIVFAVSPGAKVSGGGLLVVV